MSIIPSCVNETQNVHLQVQRIGNTNSLAYSSTMACAWLALISAVQGLTCSLKPFLARYDQSAILPMNANVKLLEMIGRNGHWIARTYSVNARLCSPTDIFDSTDNREGMLRLQSL